MHQSLFRPRHSEVLVAAGRHLAQAHADGEDQVGLTHTRREFRIDADADIAGVLRMAVIERVLKAKAAGHRQLPALCKALQRTRAFGAPQRTAGDDQGLLCGQQTLAQVA